MEVLEMLKEQGDKLTKEELKFLLDEVNTGEYDPDYKEICLGIIHQLYRNKQQGTATKSKEAAHVIMMTPEEIKDRLDPNTFSPEDRFFRDLQISRMTNSGDEVIQEYISKKTLDVDFFIKNFKTFNEQEARKFIELTELSEEQIEYLFNMAPYSSIEKTQKISEEFFIKHFNELDIRGLRKNKVTNWIVDPSIRSKKITIFLKMKGVKL